MEKKSGIKRIFYALKYSLEGLVAIFRSEAAFRQDCILFVVLFFCAMLMEFSPLEKCALITPLFILLIAEILNSSIEKCVDLCSPEKHHLAKFAKDAGSAAVFVALLLIAAVWGVIVLS